MKNITGLLIQVVSNIILAIGAIYDYWSFSSAMTIYLFEILVYILLGAVYFLFKDNKVQPGPLLFGGALILVIAVLITWYVGNEIGEVADKEHNFTENLTQHFKTHALMAWYFLPIVIVAAFVSFFKEKSAHRASFLGQLLLQRIASLFGIIALSLILVVILEEKHKLAILMAVIGSRILAEIWVYRPELRLKPKK